MIDYTVTLSTSEDMAMQYAASNVHDWIDNAVHERARIAIEEIVQFTVQKCLETNTQIPGSKDEIIILAFNKEWIKTAAARSAEIAAQANTSGV